MNSQFILRAVPGLLAAFIVGLLLGAKVGIDGPTGYIIGICALLMIVAAVTLYVVQKHQKKERQDERVTTSV